MFFVLCVGSKATGQFAAMEYSYPNVTGKVLLNVVVVVVVADLCFCCVVWTGKDQPVYKNHPLVEDVVYVDKHTQPDSHVRYYYYYWLMLLL
jgi:hypothetical protein